MKLKPIEEQVVVVFGASSGIGRETALRFARRGAKVVAAARSREGLESLVDEIRREGGEAVSRTAEVADYEQVVEVANLAVEAFGRIDTWVHTAGVILYAPFEETEVEEFRRVLDVNLLGQIHGARAALPFLRREGRGALVHVSSIESMVSVPFQSAYAASKHGIKGFVDALRLELEHEGVPISVAEIMPGPINTPLFSKARTKLGYKPMPPPPMYQPGIVADAILYAAVHPVRHLVVGGTSKFLTVAQRVSPEVVDVALDVVGFHMQDTGEPKQTPAPDNLFEPLDGYNRVEGDFSHLARSTSLYTWTQTHPAATWALEGAAAGLALLIARRKSFP